MMKANAIRELIRENGIDRTAEMLENEFVDLFNRNVARCIFWFAIGALLATLITFFCLH